MPLPKTPSRSPNPLGGLFSLKNNSQFCEFRRKRYLCSEKSVDLIVVFEKEYLKELYVAGKCSDKKHRFQPDIVRRYIDRINTLKSKESIESLYNLKSLHYEVLKGDKMGISSIRVNDQYRIEFTATSDGEDAIVTICSILELSNHYK